MQIEPPRSPGDVPVPFGYKIGWIAVRSNRQREVAERLGMARLRSASWREGIEATSRGEGIFVSPPVDGWVLAIGGHPDADQDSFLDYLADLSGRFDRVYYFGSHRVVEYQAWAIAERGEIRRAFAYLGEAGAFLLNVGERTAEEATLNTGVEDLDAPPDEETVLDLARAWGLDPREVGEYREAFGPGWLGHR